MNRSRVMVIVAVSLVSLSVNACGIKLGWPTTSIEPPVDAPKIATFTMVPPVVNAGDDIEMQVVLDRDAPPGGTTVTISSVTHTGVTSTIKSMPVYCKYAAGARVWVYTIRTERVVREPSRFTFSACAPGSCLTAELRIN